MNLTALFSIALTSKNCESPAELLWLGPPGFTEIPSRAYEGHFSISTYTYYEKTVPHPGLGWPAPYSGVGDDRSCLILKSGQQYPRRSPLSVGLEALLRLAETHKWQSKNRAAVVVMDREPGWAGSCKQGVREWNSPRKYPAGRLSSGGWGSISFAFDTKDVDQALLREYWQLAALLKRYDTAKDLMAQPDQEKLARLHQKLGPHPWPDLAPFTTRMKCTETDYPSKADVAKWVTQSGVRVAVLVTHQVATLLEGGVLDVEGIRVGHLDLSSADLLAKLLCSAPIEENTGHRTWDSSSIAVSAASAGFAISLIGLCAWKGATWCTSAARSKPLHGTDISDDESIELDDRYTETSDRERIQRVNFDMFT